VLVERRGELAEAETWYRQAADAGNSGAMNNLGRLLAKRKRQ
jgi:TPR repeat protein